MSNPNFTKLWEDLQKQKEETARMAELCVKFQNVSLRLAQRLTESEALVKEIYDWTKYKDTEWAKKAAAFLEIQEQSTGLS